MTQRPVLRKHFRYYSVISLLLLVICIFFTYYFKHDFRPEKKIEAIEKVISEKDAEIIRELGFLEKVYLINPDSVFQILDRYQHVYDKKGYIFRIRKNGQTIFWSDNKMPFADNDTKTDQPVLNYGNGWFRKIAIESGEFNYEGFYLIKRDYNYQNDYLENSYHYSYGLSKSVGFSTDTTGDYQVSDAGQNFLFSLSFTEKSRYSNGELNILFVLYLLTFLFIIGIVYELHLAIYRKTKKYLLFVFGFIADVFIIRAIIFYFEIPKVLYQSNLFSPFYYAYSDLIPSIADLFLNALVLTIIGFFIFYHLKFNTRYSRKHKFQKYFVIFTLFLHIFIFYNGIEFAFRSLIIDSSVSLDLNNIFGLSLMSFFSFLIISLFILAYILISSKLAFFAFQYCKNIVAYTIFATIAFVVYTGFCGLSATCDIWLLFFVLVYILSFGIFFYNRNYSFNLGSIVFYVLLFSIISTYSLHVYNDEKENETRKLLAVHLATEQRDPMAEYLYQREREKILEDETLLEYLEDYGSNGFDYDLFNAYFLSNYFRGYWKKYDCQITVCGPDDFLMIQPEEVEVNCFPFFGEKIITDGLPTERTGLYFLRYGPGENGYIAVIDVTDLVPGSMPLRLYVELYPKTTTRDLGFPELLVNENIDKAPEFFSYSYAKYQKGELYKRVGEYYYNFKIRNYHRTNDQFVFFNQNGYNHLFYKIDEEKVLIISKKKKNLLDILAPFSYTFLFYFIIFGLLFFIFIFPYTRKTTTLSFRTRMQISISSLILFSFLVIGIFTLIYINNLNEQKNRDILSEKTHSVLVEMQHKFSGTESFDESVSLKLSEMLVKFSAVFVTDINLFDLDGKLISSSRPQIYEEQLISRYINPEAYKALSIEERTLYIHEESIGKQGYLSAYIPFVNNMENVIAYLNLPYFAKENDLKREISAFLVAYINIYVILIAISILIAIVISNYISRPVKLIMTKIRKVKLGGHNETIDWERKDEIGQLVVEYNRMIEELARSAELLARSERESAWREMARQIAHEIKNPLTPMKLSVQYLQRAWQSNSPDWDKRLEKFTQTMIEQIDSLSIIASEFSDFAKMPVAKKENINLVEIIKSSISLYKNYNDIKIDFSFNAGHDYVVFADKEQLLRAFSNLLKNSVQAIGNQPDGRIDIRLSRNYQEHVIEISDNGGGIPEEISGKIFSPNFTTKSGGMGLGLAIVKNVIDNSGGQISYESVKGQGTTFTIVLPAV